jgi:hypothetical protein
VLLEEDDSRELGWKGLAAVGVMVVGDDGSLLRGESVLEGGGWEDTGGLPPLPDVWMIRDFVSVGSRGFVVREGITGGFD